MTDYKSTKQIAAEIREQLKKEFPNCKFSVTIKEFSGGREVNVALMSAPFAAFASLTDVNGYQHKGDYAQLNQYNLRRDYGRDYEQHICNGMYLTPEAWDVMKRADQIGNGQNWDNSDSMIDYFDVNYYLHLDIGKWNKPYAVKA